MINAARLAALGLLLACGVASAQQPPKLQAQPANSVLLVARPELEDPNFRHTVVLVTQTTDGPTVGVILNRPTPREHEGRPLWFGGPVLERVVVALVRSPRPPPASAFHVLAQVYLTMHPANIEALLAAPDTKFRLYAGFSAWGPGQLQGELGRESWYVLPAEEALLFREDTDALWEELLARATAPRT
jgi:putative transcriptional regulator